MKRLNITIDEKLYEKARALAFFRKESISEIIRKSLREWIGKRAGKNEELLLSARDEKEILEILSNDEFIDSDNVEKHLGL